LNNGSEIRCEAPTELNLVSYLESDFQRSGLDGLLTAHY
jgi:hypothetical protein